LLALAAAVWVWFFYPPGHAWMLSLWHSAVADVGRILSSIVGQAMRSAGKSVTTVAKSVSATHGPIA
jgi:hypothetical protein